MKSEQVPSEEPPFVHRLLVGLVTAVCRSPRLVLAVALGVAAVSIYSFCTRLEYRTQRSDLISERKESQQRWHRYVAEFGDDDDMVVVVRGADRGRMKASLEALAARVREQPEHFDRLFYKVDLRHLRNRALLFLSEKQIQEIQNNLQSMGALLELAPLSWRALTLCSLLTEANIRAGQLTPGKHLDPADEQFLTQLNALCRSAADTLANPAAYRSPWRGLMPRGPQREDLLAEPQYFFSGTSAEHSGSAELAFLLVRPVKEEGSFTAAQKSVAALHACVERLRSDFPELEFGLTGLPVLENDEMTASQNDSKLASWLALVGVGLLYLVVFRSLRYPLLTVGTLLIGTAWAMGWLTLTVGHLNILSATFAVMLIGMGDYGVLWVTRYEQNRAAGADVRTALHRTAAGGGPSILTAASATAIAFFAAMLADFQGVTELGWIAGSGVLLCAFACFTVLPALLMLIDRREKATTFRELLRTRSAWLPALAGRPRWVVATSLAVTAVLAVCACRVYYDHNLLNLQAQGLESVKWELTLIEHTAGASWHALSYTSTPEEALALKARYEQLPEVSRVVEAASLVPADQERKIEQLRDIQHRLRSLPAPGEVIVHLPPSAAELRTKLDQLAGKLEPHAAAAPASLVGRLRDHVVVLRDELATAPPAQASERLQGFEQCLSRDLAADLHQLRDVATPAAICLADLPESFRTRYVSSSGKWLLRVFAKDCLWDHKPLTHFVKAVRAVDPEATGKPFGTLEGLRDLKSGFEWAGLYALGAIVLVFWADFRSLRYTLLALLPLAMGIVISLGIMGLFGLPLNPANMIAFPLILGVGAVYGVHVVHDYLARAEGKPYTLTYMIGRAILVMALTNMISFGTLLISRHRGLAGLGFVLTLGIACCMATGLVFLPAVLRFLSQRRREQTSEVLKTSEVFETCRRAA